MEKSLNTLSSQLRVRLRKPWRSSMVLAGETVQVMVPRSIFQLNTALSAEVVLENEGHIQETDLTAAEWETPENELFTLAIEQTVRHHAFDQVQMTTQGLPLGIYKVDVPAPWCTCYALLLSMIIANEIDEKPDYVIVGVPNEANTYFFPVYAHTPKDNIKVQTEILQTVVDSAYEKTIRKEESISNQIFVTSGQGDLSLKILNDSKQSD